MSLASGAQSWAHPFQTMGWARSVLPTRCLRWEPPGLVAASPFKAKGARRQQLGGKPLCQGPGSHGGMGARRRLPRRVLCALAPAGERQGLQRTRLCASGHLQPLTRLPEVRDGATLQHLPGLPRPLPKGLPTSLHFPPMQTQAKAGLLPEPR